MARITVALAVVLLIAASTGARADTVGYPQGEAVHGGADDSAALKQLEPAAQRGDAKAQYRLGRLYENGQGVAVDYAKAAHWYRMAADQGYAPAQNDLGRLLRHGWGLARRYADAVKWFQLAAQQGNAGGETNLGEMYSAGEGVPLSYAEAIKWYRAAAVQGDGRAQYDLGLMYQYGEGMPQDMLHAYMWCDIASAVLAGPDRRDAADSRDQLGKFMNLANTEQAQSMAIECKASDYRKCF